MLMEFEMRLHKEPFEEIKAGIKKEEVRINDAKRKSIKPGDIIVFRKRPKLEDKIKVVVVSRKDCYTYPNLPKYYSKKEMKKWGIVVFKIRLLRFIS
jgi:ASC-1-like (ASCH) protein